MQQVQKISSLEVRLTLDRFNDPAGVLVQQVHLFSCVEGSQRLQGQHVHLLGHRANG